MASTYSTNLKIELMATGENSGSWGTTTNTNLGTALEQSIVGYGNPSYPSDANLTITLTDSNASQAARALVLNVTSAVSLTVTRELIVPTIQKQYIVQNNTTGSQSITVKTSAGTGITVPTGRKAHLYVDGTNVIQMFDFVDINGGTIDNATVGATTASSGAFTTLGATGNVTLGDADTDTITQAASYVTGTVLRSAKLATNTLALAAYDVDGTAYTNLITLTAANAPTLALTSTGTGTINNMSIGATTASTGAFTTLTASGATTLNGNTTIGDAVADTITVNGQFVTGTVLRSAQTAANTLALAAYDVDGTAYTNLITLTAANAPTLALTSTGVGTINNMSVGATTASTGAFTTLSATGVTTVQAGTALLPAITTTGDTNTGIWFPAADTIAFTEGGVESMRITSTGDVGIGTTSPSYKLDVIGSARTIGYTSTALSTPATPTAVGSASGGSLAANTWYFVIVAVDGLGGTTVASTESTVVTTTGSTSSIAVSWTAVTGAKSYQIWYANTSATQANYFTSTTNSFSLTTTTGNIAGTLPTGNTTGYVGVGTTTPSTYGLLTVASTTGGGAARISIQDLSGGSALAMLQFGINDVSVNNPDAARIWSQSPGANTAELNFSAASSGNLVTTKQMTLRDGTLCVGTSGIATSASSISIGNNLAVATGKGVFYLPGTASSGGWKFSTSTIEAETAATTRLTIDLNGNMQMQTGAVMPYAPTPATTAGATTLTTANIQSQIITASGTSYTITVPNGTSLEAVTTWAASNVGYDFFIINTASGTITLAVNTNVTFVGSLSITTATTARLRFRRTSANTFICYRLG